MTVLSVGLDMTCFWLFLNLDPNEGKCGGGR